MNKYKEAIHFFDRYIGITNDVVTNHLVEEYVDILNELANKETPTEPINKDFEFVTSSCSTSVTWGDCPKCECEILEVHNYCWNCGQKIDWRNN